MTDFIETLTKEPTDILSKSSKGPLSLAKNYMDSVITLHKKEYPNSRNDIDTITTKGLDANQVWWQVKMVLDNVEGNLMDRIQELRELTTSNYISDSERDIDLDDEQQNSSSEQMVESENESELDINKETEDKSDGVEIGNNGEGENISRAESESHSSEEELDSDEEERDLGEAEGEDEGGVKDKFGLNDQFFDIEEFNRQTIAADEIDDMLDNDKEDEDEVDYFADIPSEEDEEAIYYDDFFDKPKENKNKAVSKKSSDKEGEEDFGNESYGEDYYDAAMDAAKLDLFEDETDDEEELTSNKPEKKLSTYEKQQLEIQKQIEILEEEAIAEKKWALKGEVKAKDRPEDALLTEDLEFDRAAKPVPIITSEVTESLEDMIRRRIKNYEFDDLPRRTIHDITNKPFKPKFELSDTKSTKSLAELYENDYNGTKDEDEISEELRMAHNEITDLFNDLCYKLDALSSAHFIPKPLKKSLEVRVETAAISMEDAQPLTLSTSSTLAPQEIYKVGKSENGNEVRLKNGVTISKDEMTREDKGRLRRSMKRKKSKAFAAREDKPSKKSKKESVIDTLSKAKNVTIVNDKGEKRDVRGNIRKAENGITSNNVKL
ncbi:hypothetical protein TBLA_0D03120 [Henningerozyma blattae CBS 6284]|uniref:U3 small nucleolar ribonucleoprotein protein MPP10 n=1 Tax=Henningerozyma blattae (strain ATCC 34711 / CBS 6284 / DSM 70876 / NBRC 10599 / NRRL Y-10934 / UCD 77-7) TaxID=1071380 RepID=I2H360_HENB6|nr:hypothetical protein TBLA_0D03120 [Tetrapisispora blattae CBS 6284]CCH60812.1 hypothetical protein TBLA_0D03120 [Tetrapisispora blattae CBS 6284]